MSPILYSYKCPIVGCSQVVTIESNDETDALSRLVPAVQEHVSTAHTGVPLPGNLEDLVKTGMYQGGSGATAEAATGVDQTNTAPLGDQGMPQPGGVSTDATVPADNSAAGMPGGEPSMPGNAVPSMDVSSQESSAAGGSYAPNPTVEVPSETGMPATNPSTMPDPEPAGGETQPQVPDQAAEQPVTPNATGEDQTNQ